MATTLEKLLSRFTPDIRDAFLASVQNITNRAIIGQLVAAIEAGDIALAIRSLNLSEAAFRNLSRMVETAFETGGVLTGESFPRVLNTPIGQTVFSFDVRNSRAEAWLRDRSSRLVTAISEETRANVRTTIQEGVAEGRNPRSVALDLVGRVDRKTGNRVGGVIGLTPGQTQWVRNTRRDLETIADLAKARGAALRAGNAAEARRLMDKIESNPYFSRALRRPGGDKVILDAARAGRAIDAEVADRLVTDYKSNALRYRGEVIGRTEAITSLNQSEHEAINQAVDMGAVRQSDVKRIWDSAGNDGRTRESHLEMDGQTVGLNEPFTFPDGLQAMFPGDNSLGAPGEEIIQCRCIARTKIDWLASARDVVTERERAAIAALTDEELFGGR